MVKPELGTKRSCPSCQARFYDLNKDPIECPKCGVTFVPELLLPAKADQAVAKPRVVAEPEAAPRESPEGVEIVGLEEVEAAESGDDEAAAIKDVDLGEDTELEGEDDAFLEEVEEDEEDVPDLIVGNNDEEET